MRVTIVGPVPPYRSGVAQHTGALARAFSKRDDVEARVVSFARQYPQLLFPGDNDRDPDALALEEPPTEYVIDSVLPLSWLRATKAILEHRPDFVVVPAWTFFVAPTLGFIARRCRRNGIPVVSVVHNVTDHEMSAWRMRISRFQLRQADRFITHNRELANAISEQVPGRPVRVHPHPIFEHYPDAQGLLPRRASLELLFFGLIRPYKGLDIALKGLAASGLQDVRLSIVGEPWGGVSQIDTMIQELGLAGKVELVPRYVSDTEAAEYFARADCVVLPYRSVSGSGVVPTAYRYGKPVIVSDLPGLTDIVEHGRTGWVTPAEAPQALGKLLAEQVSAATAGAMRDAIALARQQMSWESFCEATIESVGDSIYRAQSRS